MPDQKARFIIGSVYDDSGDKQANKALDDLGKKAAEIALKFAAFVVSVKAATAALDFLKSGFETIDAQAKLARALDTSIDSLRALQLAAGDAGVGGDELTDAMRRLNVKLGDAQKGSGDAYKALQVLGLTAENLSKLDLDARVAAIADRVSELGLSSSQTADVLANLGLKNENLISLMRSGGDAIRGARSEVQDYGLSLSKVDAAKVEMANDAMARAGRVLESIKNSITIALAPLIKALADKFGVLAKQNQGFGSAALKAIEGMIYGFAMVGDVIQGLRVVFKGIELVVVGFNAVVYSAAQFVTELFAALIDSVTQSINKTINFLNQFGAGIDALPLLDQSEFMASIRRFGEEARDKVGVVRKELQDMAMEELPTDKVGRFYKSIVDGATEAAQAAVDAEPKKGGKTQDTSGSDLQLALEAANLDEMSRLSTEKMGEEILKHREMLQTKIDQIKEFALTDEEQEIASHVARMKRLQDGLESGLILEEDYRKTAENLELEHNRRLTEIKKRSLDDWRTFSKAGYVTQAKMVSGFLADTLGQFSSSNKTLFTITKAASLARAIATLPGAVIESVRNSGGVPYGLPAGIAMAALGAAEIAKIASSSFGGGSGGGSSASLGAAAAGPAAPPVPQAAPAAAQRPGGLLTVEGINLDSIFTGKVVRELAGKLADFSRDGGTVRFA